nr:MULTISPECIES: helix-turn-helix domain-containing protein [Streptomyces]
MAAVVLDRLDAGERERVLERAAHVREVLTGFRSGSEELPAAGEPRGAYAAGEPMESRYAAKAAELEVATRTVKRWVAAFRQDGEAGLVPARSGPRSGHRNAEVWSEAALEVMVEHTGQSKPSRKMVIERTRARLLARGFDEEDLPSRATSYRLLEDLERRHPTFQLSTKRNRDIAARPGGVYGKLRPTRPGEYLLMDTNRLDVFALDPVTLQWLQAELTVAMDWYTRCVLGIRITPVSTKVVDASVALYQAFRPRPAGEDWPVHALWPEHGIPRAVLIDVTALEGPMRSAASPALVPETVLVDHGKVFVSEHLTSVCRRLGISVQPARLRTGRDKGPLERFFLTLREDLLQALPGYKGPDLHSRGERPEREAFFFLLSLRRSSGSGWPASITTGRTRVWSIRGCRGCGCRRRRCSSTG